jgi:hypothetical protein
MLNAIGAGATTRQQRHDWAQIWTESEENKAITKEIERICNERKQAKTSEFLLDDNEYSTHWTTQVATVTKRTFTSYWRDPNYLLGK